MTIKSVADDVEPRASKKLRCSKRKKKILSTGILSPPLILMTMVEMMEQWGGSRWIPWRDPANLEKHSVARLRNATKSLEGGDVGLKFKLKMLEFMDSVNQEFKCDKVKRVQKNKMIELPMMQSVRPSLLTKKLSKVNIFNTF
jgi:hypothetical protein